MQINCLIIALVTWLMISGVANATDRVALVIGNANYQYDRLKNPLNDAEDVAEVLQGLGFEVEVVEDGNRKQMLKAVQRFRNKLNPSTEVAFFYYAGHGAQFAGQSYLLPLKSEIETAADLPIEGLRANDILTQMQASNSQVNVMVLDACRNLPFPALQRGGTRGLARLEVQSSALVAYSTNPGNVAKDGVGRNSPYTAELIKHLPTPNVPLIQVFNDVGLAVMKKTHGQQTPKLDMSPMPTVTLAKTASVSPEAQVSNPSIPTSQPVFKPPKPVIPLPEMMFITGGEFQMGCVSGKNCEGDERVHAVSVGDFHLAKTETTVQQYMACVKAKACDAPEWLEKGSDYNIKTGSDKYYKRMGAALTGEHYPIVGVSWDNAQQYAAWLSQKTGQAYRLPTEAEWEYAARAASPTAYPWGNQIGKGNANCDGCGDAFQYTALVGRFAAYGGLHDMHGNVWEWICSLYAASYDGSESVCASQSASSSAARVLRGGSWGIYPRGLRSASRNWNDPALRGSIYGFRLARSN